jgi:hypothetical protein
MWTSHWHWSKTCIDSHSVSLFVCLFQFSFSFTFHLTKISFWFFSFLNTETKDWHQKFLQIVQRNLLNWCKCVGRKNLNNVLYPLSFFLCFCFCFVIDNNDWIEQIELFFDLNVERILKQFVKCWNNNNSKDQIAFNFKLDTKFFVHLSL